MRSAPMIAVAVAGIVLVTAKVLISKKPLPDINARGSGDIAYTAKNQSVDGLYVALPNNLRHFPVEYFPVEYLVPLP